MLHKPGEPSVLELQPERSVVIGRQFPADVVVDERTLSRQHARVSFRHGELSVEDLDSRNGTWVNGKSIRGSKLRPGETFLLGGVPVSVHVVAAPPAVRDAPGAGPIVASPRMLELYALIRRVAPTTAPVLVLGETGSGKELIAEAIHQESPRRDKPLRVVNCPAIPKDLAESILFGHERGAFTGADKQADGLFVAANGGTLFLDEVGELTAANQAILLRALETRRVLPVGGRRELEVDVRIVAATHRNLLQAVADGTFREDLYYRLNGITLHVPPLRERAEEILPLAERFLAEAARTWSLAPRALDDGARERLCTLPWTGNVRQLRHAMEHALLVCDGAAIRFEDLPIEVRAAASRPAASPSAAPPEERASEAGTSTDFKTKVREYETAMILEALEKSGGNQRGAARLLQIPLRTLTSKLELYALRDRIGGKKKS